MLIKSSNCLSSSIIAQYFEFIEEGSLIVEIDSNGYLLACKSRDSFINYSENMNFSLNFNPVMQNDFPVIELNIKFYKNKIFIDEISTLISVSNLNEVKDLPKFFKRKECNLVIFSKLDEELKEFKFQNSFVNDLIECLSNYKIDIKDIMKNN